MSCRIQNGVPRALAPIILGRNKMPARDAPQVCIATQSKMAPIASLPHIHSCVRGWRSLASQSGEEHTYVPCCGEPVCNFFE